MSDLGESPVTTNTTRVVPHSTTAKIMHWGFIAVFIYALTKQLDEVEELEDFSLLHYEMAFASIFLVLVLGRFFYMRATRPTALPADTPRRMMLAARAVHLAMYTCLGMVAVTGLAIGGLYMHEIKSGFVMDAALLFHEIFINTTYFLILAHIAAAVYHRRKNDGIWSSMVPWIWKEKPGG